MRNFSFYLVTDTHYFDEKFGREGEAYEARSRTDQKCVGETPAIIDAGFKKLADDKETEVILIPGDLVYRGEYESHVGLRKRFDELTKQGKKIYVTTARHDYCEDGEPAEFIEDKVVPVKGMPRAELAEFYKDYGFGNAIATYKDGMSYVAQIDDDIRVLAINCDGDCHDFKGLYDEQIDWCLEQIKEAKESGNYIFAIMHYPLLPFSPVMNFIGDSKITNWQEVAEIFADAGLELIFTGHMHAQAVTEYVSKKGNKITDVLTGCFVGCPCAYRKVTFLDGKVDIKSYTIEDFDYDKNGKTAEEYFLWRFDRMITDIIDAMAYDFAFFTRLFGGPEKNKKLKLPITIVGKILQKIKLKQLGRLFFVKVDKSIGDRLVRDIAIELPRNIFVGDEPYVKGTPMYDAFEKILKRLSPILHIIEKKVGAKQPALADLKGFVLSLIGDENQRDYNTVVEINR